MTTSRVLLISLLAAGSAVVATATPAVAAKSTLRDATGDVWGSADATSATPSPTVRAGDITKAVVAYRGAKVKVKIAFVELKRKDAYAQYSVVLQGKQGKVVREVLVETSKRDKSGSHRVFNASGSEVSCDASHKVAYGNDKVTVTLARRCLSSPKAVRANVNAARASRDRVFYSDNVHDTAAESAAWTGWVRRG